MQGRDQGRDDTGSTRSVTASEGSPPPVYSSKGRGTSGISVAALNLADIGTNSSSGSSGRSSRSLGG